MAIEIRQASPADAEELSGFNDAFNKAGPQREHIEAHLRERASYETPFLAKIDGQAAGFACLRLLPRAMSPEPYAELSEIFVSEPFRRRGVGRALIRHLEEISRAAGARELLILTAWRNTDAHAFYHSLGYRLYCINMRRVLGSNQESER